MSYIQRFKIALAVVLLWVGPAGAVDLCTRFPSGTPVSCATIGSNPTFNSVTASTVTTSSLISRYSLATNSIGMIIDGGDTNTRSAAIVVYPPSDYVGAGYFAEVTKGVFVVPESINGWHLSGVNAFVWYAGAGYSGDKLGLTILKYASLYSEYTNSANVNMLSTPMSVEFLNLNSLQSAVQPVINSSYKTVATKDVLVVYLTENFYYTRAKGLVITLTFHSP
jgi:hypothetical protein